MGSENAILDRLQTDLLSGPMTPKETRLFDAAMQAVALYQRQRGRTSAMYLRVVQLVGLAGEETRPDADLIFAHVQEQFLASIAPETDS